MDSQIRTLRPIREATGDYEEAEKRMRDVFKREIYYPLLALLHLPKAILQNAAQPLVDALRSGRVTFNRGEFSGRFTAAISKELKELGARFDRKSSTWKIAKTDLPREIQHAISASSFQFEKKLEQIDEKLVKILPEKISECVKLSDSFDRALWKTDKDFRSSLQGITVTPKLSDSQRKKIADEWENNMRLFIKDFTAEEIQKLRGEIKKAIFAGNRYESLIGMIQKSYSVSANKAKFLARQETSLLMTKFKETRYADAGVKEYKWGCVAGSKLHPVRPAHKRLEGKIFRWDDPPITTEPGEAMRRNNPGQDYNCRCFALPIVRFK